jgi:hypothetical protein
VDVLGFQIKLWCSYFGIFGHLLKKLGKILFNFLVTLFAAVILIKIYDE